MNELLPALYDHLEPVALRIAVRAAALEPVDGQRAYLVDVARRIVTHGGFRAEAPSLVTPPGLEGTLGWFKLLDAHLEDFVAGRVDAGEVIAEGGGRLWETFQARDLVCAVFGAGVARALGPMLAGADVLELGTGTGGTTRRMAADLAGANRVVLSDLRQSFPDRVAADLPGVPVETAIIDINDPPDGLGPFDVVFSTNCVHVARDLPATLAWIRRTLKPGGALVLGEGSHYSELVPSPVSLVLSLFNGWWDVPTSPERPEPGFLLPRHWFGAFEAAGFRNSSTEQWTDGRRIFGGVYWAFEGSGGPAQA
jgi:SAM-dependent methyltransferase